MKPMADWLTDDEQSTAVVRKLGWFNYRVVYKRPPIVSRHETDQATEYELPVRFLSRRAAMETVTAMMVVQHDSRKALFRAISNYATLRKTP